MTAPLGIVRYGERTFFVAGELDMTNAPLLEIALEKVVEAGGPILVDLSGVSLADSSALCILMRTASGLRTGCLVIHGVNPWVRKVFDLARLDLIDNIHIIECGISPYPTECLDPSGHDLTLRLDALRTGTCPHPG